MIDSIRIKNFQGHGALTLDFTPGINTLVGDSDAGKSTVLRAIKWVAQNRPAGDENTKHGETDCRVMLTSQGHEVTRIRTPTENGYKLNDRPKYLAIGQAVPPDVTQALQLADVNFQAQSDGWFWFSLNAGERSRELNKVVDLDSIDIALTKLAGIANKRKTAVEVAQDRSKAATVALEALNHVPALQARVSHLEGLAWDAVAAENKAGRLRVLWAAAVEAGEARREAELVVSALESLVAAVAAAEEAEAKAKRLRQHIAAIAAAEAVLAVPVPVGQWERVMHLHAVADQAAKKAERLRQLRNTVDSIKIVVLPSAERMQHVVDSEVAAVAAHEKAERLRVVLVRVARLAADVRVAEQAVADAEAELATIPVCPTCGKATGDCDE